MVCPVYGINLICTFFFRYCNLRTEAEAARGGSSVGVNHSLIVGFRHAADEIVATYCGQIERSLERSGSGFESCNSFVNLIERHVSRNFNSIDSCLESGLSLFGEVTGRRFCGRGSCIVVSLCCGNSIGHALRIGQQSEECLVSSLEGIEGFLSSLAGKEFVLSVCELFSKSLANISGNEFEGRVCGVVNTIIEVEFGEIPEGIACKQFAACAVDAVLNEEAHVAGGFSEFETASTDEVLRYVSTDGSIDCISHGKRTVVGPFFACRIVGAQYLDEGRIATIGVLRAAGILQSKSRNFHAEVSLNIVPRCGVGTVSGLPSSVEISGVVTIEQIGESAFVACNCVRFEESGIKYEVFIRAEAFAFGSA